RPLFGVAETKPLRCKEFPEKEGVDAAARDEGHAWVRTFLYLMVFAWLVTSSSVAVTFTLDFVVLPLSVHSSSSPPFILYVPWSVCPNMVRFALPSLLNSAVIMPLDPVASHLPTISFSGLPLIRFWGLEPQPATNRTTHASTTKANLVFMLPPETLQRSLSRRRST